MQPNTVLFDVDPLAKLEEIMEEAQRKAEAEGRPVSDDEDGLIWETSVAIGQQNTGEVDERRWRLAKLAALVGKHYRDDKLGKFANEINEKTPHLRELRQVFVFWGEEAITELRKVPLLYYTHFRCAMRIANEAGDRQAARDFIDECITNDWSVGKAEIEMQKRLGHPISPEKIGEIDGLIRALDGNHVTFEVADPALLDALRTRYRENKPVLVKAYKPGDEEAEGDTQMELVEQADGGDAAEAPDSSKGT